MLLMHLLQLLNIEKTKNNPRVDRATMYTFIFEDLARAEKYIEAKDVSNSAGELCSISKQLQLLDSREKITLSNIL